MKFERDQIITEIRFFLQFLYIQFIQKIFIGYRETFSDTKNILNKYSIGVAHHRVMHLLSIYNGITISELLKKLKIEKNKVAIEVNGEIVERKKYPNLILNKDDKVEIVHFIGGG